MTIVRKGAPGLDAYQLAFQRDNTIGTLAEWLESLQGQDGEDATGGGSALTQAQQDALALLLSGEFATALALQSANSAITNNEMEISTLANAVNAIDGLQAEDIDTLAELNSILNDANVTSAEETQALLDRITILETSIESLVNATEGFDIILLAGQSNSQGQAGPIDPVLDAPNERIEQFDFATQLITEASEPLGHPIPTANSVGFGLGFAKLLLPSISANRRILLVPAAVGATGFSSGSWTPAGAQTVYAINTMQALMNNLQNRFVAVLWHQGERDSNNDQTEAQYAANLDTLIDQIRSEVPRAANVPFIVGDLAPNFNPTGSAGVRAALRDTPGRRPFTAHVESTGLSDVGDNTHFDAASTRILSQRYFAALPVAEANSLGIPPEANAVGHWIFGNRAGALNDLTSGSVIAPVGDDPVFDTNSLTTVDGQHGLLTDIPDAAAQTVAMVVQYDGEPLHTYGGTASNLATTGGSFLLSTGSGGLRVQTRTALGASTTSNRDFNPSPSVGDWIFIAWSHDGANYRHFQARDSGNIVLEGVEANPKALANRNVACGNAHYVGNIQGSVRVAEFLVFDQQLSVAELEAVVAGSKSRLAPRGIVIA